MSLCLNRGLLGDVIFENYKLTENIQSLENTETLNNDLSSLFPASPAGHTNEQVVATLNHFFSQNRLNPFLPVLIVAGSVFSPRPNQYHLNFTIQKGCLSLQSF